MKNTSPNQLPKEWLKPQDIQNEYSISMSTLAKWRMTNKHLPFSKIGKYIKYRRVDVETFLSSNMVKAV